MRQALRLARRGYGYTSPNPLVGALLVRGGKIIGRGWHRQAGEPHAEIEAMQDARRRGHLPRGATLYVTLEPCCTHGRTPPCTEAILSAGIRRVCVAATDPNPAHGGRGIKILQRQGVKLQVGLLAEEATALNEYFNHWITRGTPFVIAKAAMSFDGKIATRTGESRWLTGPKARAWAMHLRLGVDAILVGINTLLADDPALTFRAPEKRKDFHGSPIKRLRRIVLDTSARTPLKAQVVSDAFAADTIIVATKAAPARRVRELQKRCEVWIAPTRRERIDLRWLLQRLGRRQITSLLVEGGGETIGSFLDLHLVQRIAFFYAPLILGGKDAPKAVGGEGARSIADAARLSDVRWQKLGSDLLLTARISSPQG